MKNNYFFYQLIAIVKKPIFFIGMLLLILFSYFFIDKPLAWLMHNLQATPLTVYAGYITYLGKGTAYLIILAALFLVAYFVQNEYFKNVSIYLFLSILISGALCDFFKIVFGRSRPVELFTNHMYGFYFLQRHNEMWSFPSGHATVVTSFAVAMSFILPRLWWLFAIFAIVVSLTRVIVAAHFLSDILAGMYLGSLVVLVFTEQLKRYNALIFKPVSNSAASAPKNDFLRN